MEAKIIVKDVQVHSETGYVTYHIYSVSQLDGVTYEGPIKQYGIDAQMLRDRYNGSLEQFEAHVKQQHAHLMGVHKGLVAQAMSRKGKEL